MRKVLFVVSEIGYSWEEVIKPFLYFKTKSIEVSVATPNGKVPVPDPLSVKINNFSSNFGIGTSAGSSPSSVSGIKLQNLLNKPEKLSKIEPGNYDGLYVAGGHGALFDLNKNHLLHKLILDFDSQNKPLGLICHAASTLAYIKKDGKNFLAGKNATGFSKELEVLALATGNIHQSFLPLPIWTGIEIEKHATGRNIWTKIREAFDQSYVVVDNNLITGVGPKAGTKLAKEMEKLL